MIDNLYSKKVLEAKSEADKEMKKDNNYSINNDKEYRNWIKEITKNMF